MSNPMGGTRPIPLRIRRILLGGFIASSAGRVIESWHRRGRPGHLHPGTLTGEVIAYLWAEDQDAAMVFLSDYLAELNIHHPDAGTFGKVSLEELLRGLGLCMPMGFGELDALAEKAQRDVPELYGSAI
jgi:hypothetical protein